MQIILTLGPEVYNVSYSGLFGSAGIDAHDSNIPVVAGLLNAWDVAADEAACSTSSRVSRTALETGPCNTYKFPFRAHSIILRKTDIGGCYTE